MEIYNDTYCVYVHINKINDKKYVGMTMKNPNVRWRNGNGYKHCTYFYAAIQKYGWDGFDHEVIANNLTRDEACNFEKLLILKLKTHDRNFGYNLTLGDDGKFGCRPTEETKSKISESMKGKKKSDETKRKIGVSSIGRNVGRKHTKEELEKMRKARKKTGYKPIGNPYPRSEETKKKIQESSHKKVVLQKDLYGNVLCKYDSLSNASRKTGINLGNISSCCNGRTASAGGFMWCFA